MNEEQLIADMDTTEAWILPLEVNIKEEPKEPPDFYAQPSKMEGNLKEEAVLPPPNFNWSSESFTYQDPTHLPYTPADAVSVKIEPDQTTDLENYIYQSTGEGTSDQTPLDLNCSICCTPFNTEHDLHEHLNLHVEVFKVGEGFIDNLCTLCNRNYERIDSFRRHIRQVHGVEKSKKQSNRKHATCNMCWKEFTRNESLLQHIQIVHNREAKFFCTECNEGFPIRGYLKRHIENVHMEKKPVVKKPQSSEKRFSCSMCPREFTRNESMVQHIEIVHNRVEKYFCQECNEGFPIKLYLNRHIESVHTEKKPFTEVEKKPKVCEVKIRCTMCPKEFTRNDSMVQHIKIVHKRALKFFCPTCEQGFPVKMYLDRHIKKVHMPKIKKERGEVKKKRTCPLCFKDFSRGDTLSKHIAIQHTQSKKYVCEECGEGFPIKTYLNRHMSTAHEHEMFTCDFCVSFSLNRKDQLYRHITYMHLGKSKYKCGYQDCDKAYPDERQLADHERSAHTGERPFVCQVCNKTFARRIALYLHSKTHGEKEFQCTECDRGFHNSTLLKQHQNFHTGEKPFICEVCCKGYASAASFQSHRRSKVCWPEGTYTKEKEEFFCNICGKSFSGKNGIAAHIRNIHLRLGPTQVKCAICEKVYSSEATLKRHLIVEHSSVQLPYGCVVCPKRFFRPCELEVHMRSHTKEKPFICEICSKGFSTGWKLKGHQRVHTDREGFQCPVCLKMLLTTDSLKKHIANIHENGNGETFTCSECPRSFNIKENLRRHYMNMHRGELRRHGCSFCERRFYNKAEVIMHERQHTGERPFECDQCDLRFTRKNTLIRHQERHKQGTYNCDQCPVYFRSLTKLEAHKKKHKQKGLFLNSLRVDRSVDKTDSQKPHENLFLCALCDFGTPTKEELGKHLISQHQAANTRFQCQICYERFARLTQITEHTKEVHNFDKPFKCPSCDKRYKVGIDVKQHFRRVHLNQRPHKCEFCSESFKYKYKLQDHLSVHGVDVTRFICQICGESFKYKYQLKSHLANHANSDAESKVEKFEIPVPVGFEMAQRLMFQP